MRSAARFIASGALSVFWVVLLRCRVLFLRKRSHRYSRDGQAIIDISGCVWWYYGDRYLADSRLSDHPYFKGGVSSSLAKSIYSSSGSSARITLHKLDLSVVAYSDQGCLCLDYSFSRLKHLCRGSLDFAGVSPRVHRLCSDSILLLQRNQTNYYHFVTELAVTLFALLESTHEPLPVIYLVDTSFARYVISALGLESIARFIPRSGVLVCERVGFPDVLPTGVYVPNILHSLRRRLLSYSMNEARVFGSRSPRVLILNRSSGDGRKLLNIQAVFDCVSSYFPGAEVIQCGEMSMQEQILKCSEVEVFISPHGAQSVNIVWSSKVKHFVEIIYDVDRAHGALASCMGAEVHYVLSAPGQAGNHWADHSCPLGQLEAVMKKIACT